MTTDPKLSPTVHHIKNLNLKPSLPAQYGMCGRWSRPQWVKSPTIMCFTYSTWWDLSRKQAREHFHLWSCSRKVPRSFNRSSSKRQQIMDATHTLIVRSSVIYTLATPSSWTPILRELMPQITVNFDIYYLGESRRAWVLLAEEPKHNTNENNSLQAVFGVFSVCKQFNLQSLSEVRRIYRT